MQHNLRRKLLYQKLRESDECHQILSTCREIRLQVRFAATPTSLPNPTTTLTPPPFLFVRTTRDQRTSLPLPPPSYNSISLTCPSNSTTMHVKI